MFEIPPSGPCFAVPEELRCVVTTVCGISVYAVGAVADAAVCVSRKQGVLR